MPIETVSPMLGRRLVTGDKMMLAHVYLKKGCIVPKHQHHNEQLTYILEGCLRFWIGEDEGQTLDVVAGDVLHIPPMVWHKAEALEDTLDVDIFSPPREDWLRRTDAYLRDASDPAKK
jgi:quercetin dioxygenase-like cupin family protein